MTRSDYSEKGIDEFVQILDRFEKTRKFELGTDDTGMMSQRASRLPQFPASIPGSPVLAKIQEDRIRLRGMNIQPTETYQLEMMDQNIPESKMGTDIPTTPGAKQRYNYLPATVSMYGINGDALSKIRNKAVETHRLVRIASVHGASHSVGMVIALKKNNVQFDFAYYSHIPNEMIDEAEYVIYYTQALKIPLVMITLNNSAVEYFYRAQMWPSGPKRWCTLNMKLKPYKRFLSAIFLGDVTWRDPKDNMLKRLDTPYKLNGGQYIDIVQFLGLQGWQSPGRAAIGFGPNPSFLSVPPPYKTFGQAGIKKNKAMGDVVKRGTKEYIENWPSTNIKDLLATYPNDPVMRVFDMMPSFRFEYDDDIRMINQEGLMQNPNEREFGIHGCLCCPFRDFFYYHQLRQFYQDEYAKAIARRDAASYQAIVKTRMGFEAAGIDYEKARAEYDRLGKTKFLESKIWEKAKPIVTKYKKGEPIFYPWTQYGSEKKLSEGMRELGYTVQDPPF